MSTELEALVGHLFIVGGRVLSSPSPGSVAMGPPRKAARGRDADTFFGLVTMDDLPGEPAAFYERLANLVSQQYYTRSGSITAALRETIETANASLLAENMNRDQPAYAGVACAVLRESELIVASMGTAMGVLLRADMVEHLPALDEPGEMPPLGQREAPEVRFYRREVRAGDMLLLADTSVGTLDAGTLRQVIASKDVESTLTNLREVASDFSMAMVIQFVLPLSAEEEVAEIERQREREREDSARAAARQLAAQVAREERQRLDRAEGRPTPQPGVAAPVAPPAALPPSRDDSGRFDLGESARKGVRSGAMGFARLTGALSNMVGRLLPEDPSGARQMSVTVQMIVALTIPILVALVTTGVYIARGEASQYETLVQDALSELNMAREAGSDQALARPHWETALFLLEQAEVLRPDVARVDELRAEAEAALDFYDNVTRVGVVPLREYPAGTQLRGPIVQGTELYTLDTVNNILYHEILDDNGQNLISRDPEIITRQNELADGQTVGALLDLVWMPEGGVPQRNVLAVLTSNGLLLTYSPTWSLHAAPLPGALDMQQPRAIAVYAGNFYVLDTGSSQIWRYTSIGDSYPDQPSPVFTEFQPDLSNAIDMDIDANGNVYILFLDGTVNKYFGGIQEGFAVQGLPQPIAQPSALFIDQSPFDPAFYIADPGGNHIYRTTTTGIYSYNYKAAEGQALLQVSGVYSDGNTSTVYVAAGNSLYRFTRP